MARTVSQAGPGPLMAYVGTFSSPLRDTLPTQVDLPPGNGAWAVLPFVVGGRGVGAASFSFEHERTFSEFDREMLVAMSGQASLALERARLIEAYRRSDEQLRSALATAQLVGSFTTVLDHDRLVQLMTDELVMLVGADAGEQYGTRNEA